MRLAVLLFATLACAVANCAAASTGLAPAAPLLGIDTSSTTAPFKNPAYGEIVECEGIERRFVLLNPRVVAGEPVEFRLLLHAVRAGLGAEFIAKMVIGTDIKFIVIPPSGPSYEYAGRRTGETVPTAVLQMDEVRDFRYDFRLAMDEEAISGAAFETAGTYRIRVILVCNSKSAAPRNLEMGTFELVVQRPEGDDLKAFNILRSDFTSFEVIHTRSIAKPRESKGSSLSAAHRSLLRRLVAEAPASRLAPHARFILAMDHLYEENFDEATAAFESLAADYANDPIHEEVLFQLLRIGIMKRQESEARSAFSRIWNDPVATQLVHPGSTHWKSYVEKCFIKPGTQWMIFDGPGPDPMSGRELYLKELSEQHPSFGGMPIGVPITLE